MGVAIGSVLGLIAARLIAGLLYGVAPADPPTFLAGAARIGAPGHS